MFKHEDLVGSRTDRDVAGRTVAEYGIYRRPFGAATLTTVREVRYADGDVVVDRVAPPQLAQSIVAAFEVVA